MIRLYRDGDESKILSLFKDVFGLDRSLDYWNWQFKNQTQGQSFICVAEKDNEIVAHQAIRANRLNFLGRQIPAGQTCDSMVRSDQRGKGLFQRLSRKNISIAAQNGLRAVFHFPNRNSYPIYMRHLGRYNIAILNYYYFRIGYARLIGTKADRALKYLYRLPSFIRYFIAKVRVKANVRIEIFSKLNDNIDDLLKEYMNYEVLSVWKDLSYMRWRYENHPQFQYRFHVLFNDEHPMGLAVCRNTGKAIIVCDFIHRKRDLYQSILLLNHLVIYYGLYKAQKIEFNGWDNGFFDFVFNECKFKIMPSNIRCVARTFGDERLEKMSIISQNWSITGGDSDVV